MIGNLQLFFFAFLCLTAEGTACLPDTQKSPEEGVVVMPWQWEGEMFIQ